MLDSMILDCLEFLLLFEIEVRTIDIVSIFARITYTLQIGLIKKFS